MITEIENQTITLIDVVQKAINTWMATNTQENIQQDITDILENNKTEIIQKLLGFKVNSFGAWDIDPNLNNNGKSIAQEFLHSAARTQIEQWFNNMLLPFPDYNMQEAMKLEYEQEYKRQFRAKMNIEIDNVLSFDVHDLLTEIKNAPDNIFNKREILKNLIKGDSQNDGN